MSDFWENVLKYPRFFISSMLGLVLIISGPFLNLLKRPDTTLVLILLILSLMLFLNLTLRAMLNLDPN
nr:hypothetical protein [Cryptomonas sp. NIES-345]BDA98476.1 hypothetical protein [Cryptomonas sp. NIES-1327]